MGNCLGRVDQNQQHNNSGILNNTANMYNYAYALSGYNYCVYEYNNGTIIVGSHPFGGVVVIS
jgi:hypothetical protein